jgi:hypothetical protein
VYLKQKLRQADLRQAILRQADLRQATLRQAILRQAHLMTPKAGKHLMEQQRLSPSRQEQRRQGVPGHPEISGQVRT